jgi:hypothetical protein
MRVLAEQASAIYIERPGPEYEGFEFHLETDAGTEYHQAKRQRSGEGRWTLGALAEEGVLRAFFERLHEPNSVCVFVSTNAAPELAELADRARNAESWEEFTGRFLDSPTWRSHYDSLRKAWETSEEWCWNALRRVRVRTVDEDTLTEQLALEAEVRLTGENKSAPAGLIEVVRDSLNQRLCADDLWAKLEAKGLKPNPLITSNLGAVALRAANARFRRSRESGRIGGRLIARTETDKLQKALTGHRVVLLQGPAGMGKSEVLSELLDRLDQDGVPHLSLRLDRLKASATAARVGNELDLGAAPPVILAAAAAGKESVLVVDQLDAISTTSGRNPQFLDAVEEMLRLALADPEMRIVLACRSFDASNDARIRQLFELQEEESKITVGPLSEEQVRSALEGLGVDPKAFTTDLIDLCSVPLHLSLMGQITARSAEDVRQLKTLNDLYGRFWDDKQVEIREALGRDPHWTEVLDPIIDRMSEEPALEAPRFVVDAWKADVDAMLSANVLIEENGRLAFFHETFFDYAFARRFNGRGRTLAELLEKDQLIFRRAQVRQILVHAREGSPRDYERDLRLVLCEDWIRFHLKELVLAWLQTVSEPGEAEWELLHRLLDGDSAALADRAWLTLQSPAWFRFLAARGFLANWLDVTGEQKARALAILAAAGPDDGDTVAALLAPHQEEDESKEDLERVLVRGDLSSSRALFDLLLNAVKGNAELSRRDFWYLAHELPERQPGWACELLGSYLATRLTAGELLVDEPGPFRGPQLEPQGLHLREYISTAADGDPGAFLDNAWPTLLEVIERSARPDREGGLRQDAIWALRHFSDGPGDLEGDLLDGAERAMAGVAKGEPERFEELLEAHADTPYETVVFLIFEGLAANPERFADRAIDFLLAATDRFRVGHSDGVHWGTRRLLEATSPHCSDAAMQRLEEALLRYYTPWEKSVQSRGRQFGLAQFELLGGVAAERRTPAMRKRFAELQRKFGAADAPGPLGIRGGAVGSPIRDANARLMDDANWKRAMEHYASEERPDDGDFLKGGARELASVLETLSGEDPVRFSHLGRDLPDDINLAYFEAILRGVGKGEVPLPLGDAEALIERCHALPGKPCGQWIGHPLRPHLESEISDATLEILSWYATEGEGASTISFDNDDEEEADHRLLTRGLNSVRGGMAYEFARLIYADGSRISKLEPALRRLCSDASTPVRALAAEATLAVAAHDTQLGVNLFGLLTEDSDDELMATRFVRRFLAWSTARDFGRFKPLIERMTESPLETVRTEGAAQAGLATLTEAAAQPLAEKCIRGPHELRLGVMRAFAHNLESARHRARCEEGLEAGFNDDDASVRKEAAGAIQRLTSEKVAPSAALIERFLESQAFEEHVEAVMFALEDAAAVPAALSLKACERVLDMLISPDAEIRRAGQVAREVSDVLIRAYVDSADDVERGRALDVIDRSLELNAYGAQRALSEYDRS